MKMAVAGYRGGRSRTRKSVEFRDICSRWFEERGVSLSWLSHKMGIARETLRLAITEGRVLSDENLLKVAQCLGIPRSEWEPYTEGVRLLLPSDDPVWQMADNKVQQGPYTETTLRLWEQFLTSATEDIARLAA